MSLLQLPLTNESIMSSYYREWRTARHTSFPHPTHRPVPPHLPIWLPSTSVAIFVTLQFSDLVLYVPILKTFHVKNSKMYSCVKHHQSLATRTLNLKFLQPPIKYNLYFSEPCCLSLAGTMALSAKISVFLVFFPLRRTCRPNGGGAGEVCK